MEAQAADVFYQCRLIGQQVRVEAEFILPHMEDLPIKVDAMYQIRQCNEKYAMSYGSPTKTREFDVKNLDQTIHIIGMTFEHGVVDKRSIYIRWGVPGIKLKGRDKGVELGKGTCGLEPGLRCNYLRLYGTYANDGEILPYACSFFDLTDDAKIGTRDPIGCDPTYGQTPEEKEVGRKALFAEFRECMRLQEKLDNGEELTDEMLAWIGAQDAAQDVEEEATKLLARMATEE